jgi:hypothetical protein
VLFGGGTVRAGVTMLRDWTGRGLRRVERATVSAASRSHTERSVLPRAASMAAASVSLKRADIVTSLASGLFFLGTEVVYT